MDIYTSCSLLHPYLLDPEVRPERASEQAARPSPRAATAHRPAESSSSSTRRTSLPSAFQRALHYCSSATAGLQRGVDHVDEACRVSPRCTPDQRRREIFRPYGRQEITTNGDHLIDAFEGTSPSEQDFTWVLHWGYNL